MDKITEKKGIEWLKEHYEQEKFNENYENMAYSIYKILQNSKKEISLKRIIELDKLHNFPTLQNKDTATIRKVIANMRRSNYLLNQFNNYKIIVANKKGYKLTINQKELQIYLNKTETRFKKTFGEILNLKSLIVILNESFTYDELIEFLAKEHGILDDAQINPDDYGYEEIDENLWYQTN